MTTLVSGGALPVGALLPFGGPVSNIPDGFLLCDGSLLNRNDFSDLFAAIGTSWGSDSGVDFRVPTTQGLFLRGQANGSLTYDPNKDTRTSLQVGSNAGDNVGSYQVNQFSSHNHGGGNHSHNLEGRNNDGNTTFLGSSSFGSRAGSSSYMSTSNGSAKGGLVFSSGTIISTQGGSQNNPNNVYVNYIIKF